MAERDTLGQSCLPKARQWLAFLEFHDERLPGDHGWAAALKDTLLDLHHAIASAARRLRGNPVWDIQGTMTDDTERLEDRAARMLRRVEGIDKRDVPLRFEPLLDCVIGACRQQVRLAREIDRMQLEGHISVDVTADLAAKQVVEAL